MGIQDEDHPLPTETVQMTMIATHIVPQITPIKNKGQVHSFRNARDRRQLHGGRGSSNQSRGNTSLHNNARESGDFRGNDDRQYSFSGNSTYNRDYQDRRERR
ncbi:hypothetical protein DPMN_164496 [Dreissena polymorpha]|uniref:Uncharacterized protein n=1 Tax=Dreissena polymorpha TaxID=45954 RepID=A0A9D4EVB7_DREPO|nr:hypothetical protein DPMN_164496 [Dreissena polymorpha]